MSLSRPRIQGRPLSMQRAGRGCSNNIITPLLATLAMAFALAGCNHQTVSVPGDLKTRKASFDSGALDRVLATAVSEGEVVGVSALVFDEGQTVYTGAFGFSDRERAIPMARDTVVRIYSMTKTITSAMIMDLVEEGKLSLTDPAARYIPELAQMQVMGTDEEGKPVFSPQASPMTIKDLLLHRSGIAYGIFGASNRVEALYEKAGLFVADEPLAAKMTKLSKLPLITQPGTGWYYSYSTDVLGRIVEIVTGKPLDDVMQERLFTPCAMTQTGYYVRPDQQSRFASTYFLQEDGSFALAEDAQESPFLIDDAYHSGGGGLVSTLDDYAIFARLMLDNGTCGETRILEADTVRMMMSNQMDPDDLYLFPWLGGETNNGFGFGGAVVIADNAEQIATNGQSIGQFGWSGAARTTYWVDQPNGAFAIIFLQYFGGSDPDLHRRFRVLVREQTKN